MAGTPTTVERDALAAALRAAATPGVPFGPNPRVGCAVLDPTDALVAVGHHRGAGTAHAEVDALEAAGERARGGTAVVTLEPCDHTGRTGPCTEALLAAGVRRVVVALRDPHPIAAGGAERLRAAGVDVVVLDPADPQAREAYALNRGWLHGLAHGRPFVTWKSATTLDGRVAAADGSSRWITGPEARADVHARRAEVDTMLIGTGTALTDDPALTVRDAAGAPADHQPLRVVAGHRPLPADARLLTDGLAETVQVESHDPAEVLAAIHERGRREVLLEGGPTLAAAFLRAGLVDEVVAYVAPALLGAGASGVGDLGVATLDAAVRFDLVEATALGGDVRLVLRPTSPTTSPTTPDRST